MPFQPAPNPGEIVVSDGTLKLRSIRSTGEHWTAITTLGPRSSTEPNYANALTFEREQYACEPTFDSTAQPMHLILTSAWYAEQPCRAWLFPTGCPPKPDFTELEVDYVRVWQLTN